VLRTDKYLPLVAICAMGLLAVGCQSSNTAKGGGETLGTTAKSHRSKPATDGITISPANGSKNVNPAGGITVTSTRGKIKSVSVSGDQVSGSLNTAATAWHSQWTLPVDATLTVAVTSTSSSGQTVHQTSTFKTLNPSSTFTTEIFEGYQQQYGVGMPIILYFSQPIINRAAVERSLVISTSKPVVGAWYWDNDETLIFRPRVYWPPDTRISFTGHLNGVEGAPGMYGFHTLTQQFHIGQSLIVVASTTSHHMRLYENGRLFRSWPISTGRPGLATPNGTYVTINKGNPVLMKGPGYALEVPWSVRFTWSGDYLHDAYWSVSEQGFVNVSHGCVNMPPADAEFYYKLAVPGDPVTVVGSSLRGTWDNGWTYWFLSWPQLLGGSSPREAVIAGPHGSTFASPATLTAATGAAPIDQPWPRNSWAG
jgi:lipoprotein-anchoring transpeptidase ErfK/SrfK